VVYECVKTADLSKGYQNPKRKLGCRYYIFDNWRKTQTTATEVEKLGEIGWPALFTVRRDNDDSDDII